jgi:hypothetical protein
MYELCAEATLVATEGLDNTHLHDFEYAIQLMMLAPRVQAARFLSLFSMTDEPHQSIEISVLARYPPWNGFKWGPVHRACPSFGDEPLCLPVR